MLPSRDPVEVLPTVTYRNEWLVFWPRIVMEESYAMQLSGLRWLVASCAITVGAISCAQADLGREWIPTSAGDPPAATMPSPSPSSGSGRWMPEPGTTWQWQLTGAIDTTVDAEMFNIDLFDASSSVVAQLHGKGAAVVCYLSAGSWENWRPDADDFPQSVLGSSNGWPGEKWIDIRKIDVVGPIMEARFDLCKAKGFDAIEVDNIDGYTNNTGFPLKAADQLAYNRFLADAAHARGLSIGLKNDLEQVNQLVSLYDFAINEQCAQYDECDMLTPFIAANKAVFHVEYSLNTGQFCDEATALGFSSMKKELNLNAWRQYCT